MVALTRTYYWHQLLDDGVVGSGSEIAQREGLHHSTVNELLRLTLLEPAIIQAILAGQQQVATLDGAAEIGDRCFVTALAAPDVGQQPLANVGRDGLPALAGRLGKSGQ